MKIIILAVLCIALFPFSSFAEEMKTATAKDTAAKIAVLEGIVHDMKGREESFDLQIDQALTPTVFSPESKTRLKQLIKDRCVLAEKRVHAECDLQKEKELLEPLLELQNIQDKFKELGK